MIRKSSALLGSLAFFLLPLPSSAETLKETADRLCHAYIETPEDFKKIDMTPCTAKTGDKHECFKHNNRTFVSHYSSGSCLTSEIAELKRDLSTQYLKASNITVNGYGFGVNDLALKYQDHLLITNGYDLRLVKGNNQFVLCGFLYKSEKWQSAEPPENSVCRKLSETNFSISKETLDKTHWLQWPPYPHGRPIAVYNTDLNNDGETEAIVNYEYSSGSCCGCEAKILMLYKNGELIAERHGEKLYKKEHDATTEAFGKRLQSLTSSCDNASSHVVRIEEKNYILMGELELKAPISSRPPTRNLWEYKDGNFQLVCSQKADAKKVIDYEIYKGEARSKLNYTPLDEMENIEE